MTLAGWRHAIPDLDHVPVVTATVLAALVLVLTALDTVIGARTFRRFTAGATGGAGSEPLRLRLYRRWVAVGSVHAVVALVAVAALPGVTLVDLGLRAPDLSRLLSGQGAAGGLVTGLAVGAVLGIAGAVVGAVVGRRRAASSAGPGPLGEQAAEPHPLHPRTPTERRWWAALSLSAGVTEEIVYRGAAVLALVAVAPGLPAGVVVLVVAVLFGLAHWYQGRAGVIATAALGAALTLVYLGTSSLLLPVLLHVAVDLLVLLRTPRGLPDAGGRGDVAP